MLRTRSGAGDIIYLYDIVHPCRVLYTLYCMFISAWCVCLFPLIHLFVFGDMALSFTVRHGPPQVTTLYYINYKLVVNLQTEWEYLAASIYDRNIDAPD